jgi:hypothetical protein
MQEDVQQVVAERRVAPEAVLDPEGGMKDRIVLLGRVDVRPDAGKAGKGAKVGTCDVARVVPEQGPVERGPIAGQHKA